jgi:hypothetical protein
LPLALINGQSSPAGVAREKEAAFMKRILLVLAVMAVLMLALAAPAFADVVLLNPPGPPAVSGHDDAAAVGHCNSPSFGSGGSGVIVLNKQGFVHNNCEFT